MKNMKYTKVIIILLAIAVAMTIYVTFNSNGSGNLTKAIIQKAKSDETIRMSAIAPFEWDRAYIIEDPYISGEALNKLVGTNININDPLVDIKRRIIFINDNKLAYDYVYDWREISFTPLGASFDKAFDRFLVEQNGAVIKLRWIPDDVE